MRAWIQRIAETSPRTADLGLLIVRVAFGLTMAVQHGFGKISDLSKFTMIVEKLGFPLPWLLAPAAAVGEFAAALLVAIGLLTRPAAALMAMTMLNAAFVVHSGDPFKKKELALAYAIVAIAVFVAGPGRYSADARIARG